jgi:hypothetical protein
LSPPPSPDEFTPLDDESPPGRRSLWKWVVGRRAPKPNTKVERRVPRRRANATSAERAQFVVVNPARLRGRTLADLEPKDCQETVSLAGPHLLECLVSYVSDYGIIELEMLRVKPSGQRLGDFPMRCLCAWADDYNLAIDVAAVAQRGANGPSQESLERFYRRHGFGGGDADLRRPRWRPRPG